MQLLGIRMDNYSKLQVFEKIKLFLSDGRQHYIVLPYSNFLVQAQKDGEFRQILNQADLSLSDGIGPVIASYFCGSERLRERVKGVDLVESVLNKFGKDHSIFFFGAKEAVAKQTAENLLKKYPETKIAGFINGYVSDDQAIEAIQYNEAEILFVALGMPKQEKWIARNLAKMPSVRLAVAVGGAFDFLSGRKKRAPKIFQTLGLEWLWRFFLNPRDWRKFWRAAVVFPILIIKQTFSHS